MVKKLEILHVSPFFPPHIGGIANLVNNLCRALANYDMNITIITSAKMRENRTTEANFKKVVQMKSLYFPGWPYSTLKNFSVPIDFGIRINSIIDQGEFDVVHLHGHHYPITWIALNHAYKKKIPTVLSLHGTYALNPKKVGGKSYLENLFNKIIFKNILAKSDVVIGGTSEIIEYAKRYSSSIIKFKLVSNGVNVQNYRPNLMKKSQYRNKHNLCQDKLVVLFVGRFDESKGALEFANAAKMLLQKHPDKFQVLMVGEGSLEAEIKKVTMGVNGIQVLEWQPSDLIHEAYIASDIFVLPSKFEGLPLSIIEAMNANLYIVYSNVGGVNDILQGYAKKKILVNPIHEEIYKILVENYRDKSITEVHQPSIIYAQSFDWLMIAKEVADLYRELIASGKCTM